MAGGAGLGAESEPSVSGRPCPVGLLPQVQWCHGAEARADPPVRPQQPYSHPDRRHPVLSVPTRTGTHAQGWQGGHCPGSSQTPPLTVWRTPRSLAGQGLVRPHVGRPEGRDSGCAQVSCFFV